METSLQVNLDKELRTANDDKHFIWSMRWSLNFLCCFIQQSIINNGSENFYILLSIEIGNLWWRSLNRMRLVLTFSSSYSLASLGSSENNLENRLFGIFYMRISFNIVSHAVFRRQSIRKSSSRNIWILLHYSNTFGSAEKFSNDYVRASKAFEITAWNSVPVCQINCTNLLFETSFTACTSSTLLPDWTLNSSIWIVPSWGKQCGGCRSCW